MGPAGAVCNDAPRIIFETFLVGRWRRIERSLLTWHVRCTLTRMASTSAATIAARTLLSLSAGFFAGVVTARRRFQLAGKNALVTGGERGLGLEIARALADKGANVAIVARDLEAIERALEDLRGRCPPGVQLVGAQCNLLDKDSIERTLASVRALFGPIDVLVNNAGTIQVGPLDAMRPQDFEESMRLHCFAPLYTMLGVRDDMRERGGGRIANVSSIGGIVPVPHLLPYSASKFALMGLSQGMHTELSGDNIVVSTIAPGLMRTGSPPRAFFKGDHEKEYAWFAISDALPILSVASARAARRIVRAIELGEAHVVIGLPAKVAAFVEGVAPGVVARALTAANAALPSGTDPTTRMGLESDRLVPPSLAAITDRAAERNNEW